MSTTTSAHSHSHTESGDGTAVQERADADDQNSVSNSNEDPDVEMDDAEHEVDDLAETKPKKKRRVIKSYDKKYQCPAADCGKAYSRAEHLYRHQLNHTPKQIYHCDFPGCDRHFVRADLCARHKERHTAKGSHLQRKDAFMNSQRGSISLQTASKGVNSPPAASSLNRNTSPVDSAHAMQSSASNHTEQYRMAPSVQTPQQSYQSAGGQYSSHQLPPLQLQAGAQVDSQLSGSSGYNAFQDTYTASGPIDAPQSSNGNRRYSMEGQYAGPGSIQNGYSKQQQNLAGTMQPPPPPQSLAPSQPSNSPYSQTSYQQSPGSNFRPPQNYSTLPALPPFSMPQSYGGADDTSASNTMPSAPISMDHQYQVTNDRGNSVVDFNVMDQFGASYALPVRNARPSNACYHHQ